MSIVLPFELPKFIKRKRKNFNPGILYLLQNHPMTWSEESLRLTHWIENSGEKRTWRMVLKRGILEDNELNRRAYGKAWKAVRDGFLAEGASSGK